MALNYKRDVPSKINQALKKRQIHAGFISSIESPRYRCTNVGIIANKAVYSVFVIQGENKKDQESATSNHLAQILKLDGTVLIGDKALKYYLKGGRGIDLADVWYQKTHLPFVFARLCYNNHGEYIKKISRRFLKMPIKIPQYILKKEASARNISPKELKWYLQHINYQLNHQSQKSLKRFLKEVKKTKEMNKGLRNRK